jgi:hypothetical protein
MEVQDQGFGQVCLILPDGIGGDISWLAYGFLFVFAPSTCQL